MSKCGWQGVDHYRILPVEWLDIIYGKLKYRGHCLRKQAMPYYLMRNSVCLHFKFTVIYIFLSYNAKYGMHDSCLIY